MSSELASTQMADHIHDTHRDFPIFGNHLAFLAQKNVRRNEIIVTDEAAHHARVMASHVRALLASENPHDIDAATTINSHFNAVEMPVMKQDLTNRADTVPDDNILAWLAGASERDIAVFAIYHRRHHNELHHNLRQHLPALRSNILEQIDYVVENDIFPKHAKRLYKAAFDTCTYLPFDSFLYGSGNLDGFYVNNQIYFATPYNDAQFTTIDMPKLTTVCIHETTHSIGSRFGRGFFNGIKCKGAMPNRATEEFFVTHIEAVTASKKKPDIIDPDKRHDGMGRYYYERKLHAMLSEDIPADLWGHAYAHSKYSPRGISLRRELARGITKGFGSWKNYLDFSNEYSRLDTTWDRKELTSKTIRSLSR